MTVSVPDTAASSTRSIVVPAPSPVRSPWLVSVVAALAACAAVGTAGAARGDVDLVVVLLSGASVLAAQSLGGLVARRAGRAALTRWFAALDETEAVCDASVESRRRSLRQLWPTSSDLAERLRRGEAPPVVGVPSLVVLGVGRVDSGIVLVSGSDAAVVRHARTEALVDRVSDLADGPLCVDAAGGVHVRGPALLARSLAGGWRAQLRHRGARDDLVTWQATGPAADVDPTVVDRAAAGPTAGGGGDGVQAACVVDISSHGAVTVVRRQGSACSVPVTAAWTSLHDAPDELDAPAAPNGLEPGRPQVRPGRP